jgi:ribosomal protein S18 acetylase RimI-like enzyme
MAKMTSNNVRFQLIGDGDAEALAEISRRAFDNDSEYGAPGPGGPPGYDSVAWQRRMSQRGRFFKVIEEDRIVGGFVVFRLEDGGVELGRVFIEPDCQNRGIGSEVLRYVEGVFPATARVVVDTPGWNLRNQHFYEKAGFVKIGEINTGEEFPLFQYEKTL